jgi:hydrogenase maturation factor HypF (carbamoyltransferase family)
MDRDANLLIDSMQKFDSIEIDRVNVLENDTHTYHSKQLKMAQDEASFISVIAEHNIFDKKCVGVYFNDEPTFLYYNTKSVVRIIPPVHFQSKEILSHIQDLRDGSERLVQNLQHKMPEVYKKLQNLQDRDDVKLFEAVSIILGLKDESMRGLSKEAMKFIGKGGIQIDTHIKDNRFDYAAFLASIISYQLAGVSSVILSYSIFESFGDYFSEIVQELKSKTDSTEIILCGTHFANQSLFSRMQNNLKMTPPLMNINYPIGKENAVVGGAYL